MKKILFILAVAIFGLTSGISAATPHQKSNRHVAKTRTSVAAATTLPDGFDINTIFGSTYSDGSKYYQMNQDVVKDLSKIGFKFLRKTTRRLELGSDDPAPVKMPAVIYTLGRINVEVVTNYGNPYCIKVTFPNKETFRQFIDSALRFGFTERAKGYYGIDGDGHILSTSGLTVTLMYAA